MPYKAPLATGKKRGRALCAAKLPKKPLWPAGWGIRLRLPSVGVVRRQELDSSTAQVFALLFLLWVLSRFQGPEQTRTVTSSLGAGAIAGVPFPPRSCPFSFGLAGLCAFCVEIWRVGILCAAPCAASKKKYDFHQDGHAHEQVCFEKPYSYSKPYYYIHEQVHFPGPEPE